MRQAGAGDTDGPHDEPHAVFLPGEHVLDCRAHGGSFCIGPGDAFGHRPARRLLLVDVAGEHPLGEERLVLLRSVGRVRPDTRSGVVLADHVGQPGAIVGIGRARIPCADQPVDPVDADVVLVPEYRDGEVDRLECLGIDGSYTTPWDTTSVQGLPCHIRVTNEHTIFRGLLYHLISFSRNEQ